MLKFFASYVLVVFAMKAFVTLTRVVTFTIAQTSSRSMNSQSWVSRWSRALSISHVEHVRLDGLSCFFIESCECVLAWSRMHISIAHTLSSFCWSFGSRTMTPPLTWLFQPEQHRSIKQVFSSCATYKKFNPLSYLPPRKSVPTVTPELTPLKNCTKAISLTYSTN